MSASSRMKRARRAWQRHGALGFCRLALRNLTLLLSRQGARHRYVNDPAFDRKYGVDTGGAVEIDEMTAPAWEKEGAVPYEPTPPEMFEFLLDRAEIADPGDLLFVDLGSGKGRTLILACLAGFRRAEGVELGEELHATAADNLDRLAKVGRRLNAVSIRGDARSYQFPREPTVCFLNNPFSADVLAGVVRNIERSLRDRPRDFTVIYYHSNHEEVFGGSSWERIDHGFWNDRSHHYAIYRSKIGRTADE